MAEPMGFAHYRDNYSDEELWAMLVTAGNPLSIELSTSVWATTRGKLEGARGSLNTNMVELAEYWQGPASDEFQTRMALVHDYSAVAEERMRLAEGTYLPGIAASLRAAQGRAMGENALGESLNPDSDLPFWEDWAVQVKGEEDVSSLGSNTRTALINEHAAWREARHDELAQTVADLGTEYARMADEYFAEPAPPPPDGMPGNTTYQQPTTGVFAQTTSNSGSSTDQTAVSPTPATEPVSPGEEDDVASPWMPPSYDDLDEPSGGLASGGPISTAPSGGSFGTVPGAGTSGAVGGTGAGFFPPGRGSAPGSMPGRAPGTTGPVRPGQPGAGRGGPGQPGRSGMPGRGGANAPGTRRAGDEVEEEETEARESKYVQAEDVFSAPFDPSVGPAHEGPKHQRAWNKQYDAWKRQQEENGEA